ncbi:TonB-dependent receptor [candidate division KSB1 bacterium]|nr:TonB-dependent receptor [candidate division KSB1 bacterium]
MFTPAQKGECTAPLKGTKKGDSTMYKKIYAFAIAVLTMISFVHAATLTQVIKGRVIDQDSKVGLAGANVVLKGTDRGAATDVDGYFRIPQVPVGRQSLKVMYMGYQSRVISEILVGSAKQVKLTIELQQKVLEGKEIVVTPTIEKSRSLNSMAAVSARSFSVEETQRYAGGFDDPARLASSFAGITFGNAQDNAIIIRGNAPKGLLWRLEGIEIPNPNHFPDGNVLGGGLFTIFSNQMLANSDFMTGAFPAEYGNALSGVFDMKLRNGNSDVREWTFQSGLLGIDFSGEGPLGGSNNASYLFNYRYSTIGLLTDLNAIDTDQQLNYQDLSFKVNVPTKNAGTFSLWGIGSMDRPVEVEEPDSSKWEHDWDRLKYTAKFRVGAIGLNHKFVLDRSTFLNSTLAMTAEDVIYDLYRLDEDLDLYPNEYIDSYNGRVTLTSTVNHKFGPRFTGTTGFAWNNMFYDMNLKSTVDDDPETYQTFVNENGNSQHVQAFAQGQWAIAPELKLNAGLHYEVFMLNDHKALEPRVGLNWAWKPNHMFSFGYGRHSQLENIRYYLAKQNTAQGEEMPNKNLGFTRADHFVFGYDMQLSQNTRLKIEPYYQRLFDVPVRPNDYFSFINLKDERYFNDTLVNDGTGTNMGIDFTLEKFLSNGYYYLITASLFDSKYTGGDGIERDSRYNRNVVVNALYGKEFMLKENNILGVNLKLTYMGGERTSPVLRDASLAAKRVIHDHSRAFSESLTASKYLDITVTYRLNHQRISHTFALQIKNLLSSPNDYGYIYSFKDKDIVRDEMVIVFPSISYKVEF